MTTSRYPARPRAVLHSVQALRAVAAIAVVAAHIAAPDGLEHKFLPHGTVLAGLYGCALAGVDLFFVVSGFVMMTTARGGAPGPRGSLRFLWRRATRIYPPYLVVTALLVAAMAVIPSSVGTDGRHADLLASVLLVPQSGHPLLGVGWTLGYELYFYCAFALVLLLPRQLFGWGMGAWAVGAAVMRVVTPSTPLMHVLHSPLVFEFLAGVVVGAIVTRAPARTGALALALGLAGTAAICVLEWMHPGSVLGRPVLRAATIGPALALVLLGVVALERAGRLRVPAVLVRLGGASYSIYLTHLLTLGVLGFLVVRLPWHDPLTHALVVVGALVLAVGIGAAFFAVVERPVLRVVQSSSDSSWNGIRSLAARRSVRLPAGV